MLPTDAPFCLFFDLDGTPLDSGYIYFGQPNQNPETAPITVYWDAAGTQPAAQPIRTVNGYAVRNGNIANVFASSEYSITVRNKSRVLVYSEPTSIAFDSSIFIQSGNGAVARPTQDKLRETVSAEDYGVVGDGVVDDTVAMRAFLTAIAGKAGYLPPGTYLCDSLIIYSGTRLVGAGRGSTIIKAKPTLAGNAALLRNNVQSGVAGVYDDKNISIEGIAFNGNGLGTRVAELVSLGKVERPTVRDCIITNVGYVGLAIGGCALARVLNNGFDTTGNPVVTAEGGAALWIGNSGDTTKCTDTLVEGNTFTQLQWAGIYANGDRTTIRGNHFNNVKEAGIFGSAYIGLVVVGNSINGVTRKNISASGIETGAQGVVISGNRIYNVQNCNIALTDTQGVVITGNLLAECRQDAAYYPTASGVGIVTSNPAPNQPKNIHIADNVFSSFSTQSYAFVSVGNSGAAVEGLTIRNNNCVGNTYVSGKGVYFQAGKRGINCALGGNIGTADATPVFGKLNITAAAGAKSVAGIGFKPQYLKLMAVIPSATYSSHCDVDVTPVGVTQGKYSYSANGVASAASNVPTPRAINLQDAAGAVLHQSDFTSFDDDGFTITTLAASVSASWLHWVAYP